MSLTTGSTDEFELARLLIKISSVEEVSVSTASVKHCRSNSESDTSVESVVANQ